MDQEVKFGLVQLPNIGATLARELKQSGIASPGALTDIGSLAAAAALRTHGFDICSNKLYALEGAIQGIRWHNLLRISG